MIITDTRDFRETATYPDPILSLRRRQNKSLAIPAPDEDTLAAIATVAQE